MTCKEFTEFLNAYLSSELLAEEQAEFERHLAVCKACVDYLNSYRRTIALTKKAYECGDEPVPAEVPEELVRAILAARPKRQA